jgi:hypothetical protein
VAPADGWFGALFRTKVVARVAATAMRFERVRTLAFRTISQIGIRYPRSPLSRTLAGLTRSAPAAGDRFPWIRIRLKDSGPVEDLFQALDDTRFNLLAFGQPAPVAGALDGFGELLSTHAVPQDAGNAAELARRHSPAVLLPAPPGRACRPVRRPVGCGGNRTVPLAMPARSLITD